MRLLAVLVTSLIAMFALPPELGLLLAIVTLLAIIPGYRRQRRH